MKNNDIAVIGMAGRFPGAYDINEFWGNLLSGKDTVSRNGEPVQKNGYSEIGAFGKIDDVYKFDAAFFDMNEKEAAETDPQERLLLELSYLALENAGVVVNDEYNRVGIVCGAKENEYALKRYYETNIDGIEKETAKMYLGASLATRAAYKLNLQGPGMQIKATCATGLAAAHIAGNMLINREADIMLAGSVNLTLENDYYMYMEGGITSKDSFGRAFSSEATGCVPGDGGGIVVLKRYEDAINDKDNIIAVISGSALLNDGKIKMGFSAPSREAEQRTVLSALKAAGITADNVDYVETHGTATKLGDMVEIAALKSVFQGNDHLTIGAVKNNIGHLNYAAGIAGLIKTALVVKNRKIPPVVNVVNVNPTVTECGFSLNREVSVFENTEKIFTAGVSSFGIGGNNVHVVLHEPDYDLRKTENTENIALFLFSAKTEESLKGFESCMEKWIFENPELWTEAEYTLYAGRKKYNHRSFWIGYKENGNVNIKKFYGSDSLNYDEELVLDDFSEASLIKAGRNWLSGKSFKWASLENKVGIHKISLPSYCFVKNEYNLFSDEEKKDEKITAAVASSEMSRDDIEKAINNIFKEVIGSGIESDDDLDELGIDSLNFVIISSRIEARFNINISVLDLYEFNTPGDLVDRIASQLGSSAEKDSDRKSESTQESLEHLIELFE